jgi:dTDP-4-amino-4,6-dideoxygalactose transaminase
MTNTKSKRIFLSPPHMGGEEMRFVREAFESNYIAPVGPIVDAFEQEFAEYVGIKHCLALSSGTAAMHLAFRILGVGQGDDVIASTLTFIGSVTPVVFQGASLVFVDCDRQTWNMDPGLLEEELAACERRGKMPKAVIPTDLYGQCCDLPRIVEICDGYGVPVVCDSAEALGAKYLTQRRKDAKGLDKNNNKASFLGNLGDFARGKSFHAGKGAKAAVYSFNGNKIITTSGGGMLASDDKGFIDYARKLSQQAREDFPHYEHTEIGYNYRMSNVLAAIGRGQLRVLDERVKKRREIFDYYQEALGDLPGIEFMPEPEWSRSNRWLTVIFYCHKMPLDFNSR